MRLSIIHTTHYNYDQPVPYGLLQIRLTPKSRKFQKVESWTNSITGGKREATFEDEHANTVELISFDAGSTSLKIRSEGVVETTDTQGVVGEQHGFVPLWCFQRRTDLTRPGPNVRRLVKELDDPGDDIPRLHALSALILEHVEYKPGRTDAGTPSEAAIGAGEGVCQDHAHIFITAARLLGYPARYVSGYLWMPDRIEQDAGHAWAEAWVDGVGWIGFDVSNGKSPDDYYVRVATGLDSSEAAPISGTRLGSAGESMSVSLQVQQQ